MLLLPVACVLAIVLSMNGSMILRPRAESMRTFLQIIIWQFVLLGLLGLLARSSSLGALWIVVLIAFLIHLWLWERGMARSMILLVLGAGAVSSNQQARVVHFLTVEGRGYWRRLSRRFNRIWQTTGDWQLALLNSNLAEPVRLRLALVALGRQQNINKQQSPPVVSSPDNTSQTGPNQNSIIEATNLETRTLPSDIDQFHRQLAQTALEQKQVSQWLGRLTAVSLTFGVILLVGILSEFGLETTFESIAREIRDTDSAFELRPTAWSTFLKWKLHYVLPILVGLFIFMLFLWRRFPYFARRRPAIWFLNSYYRAVVLESLAIELRSSPDAAKACERIARVLPVPSWTRRLRLTADKLMQGQPLIAAMKVGGLLREDEAVTLSLCHDTASLSWAMQRIGESLLERTMNRAHLSTQLLTVGLTLIAAIPAWLAGWSLFSYLNSLITFQL